MPEIKPKETVQKTYRISLNQANAMEKLAKCVGRTQNELFVIAIEDFLMNNRRYFLDDWAVHTGIDKVREAVFVRREGVTVKNGPVTLDIVRLDKDQFDYEVAIYNRYEELQDSKKGILTIHDVEEWESVFQVYVDWVIKYTDVEQAEVKNYFCSVFVSR